MSDNNLNNNAPEFSIDQIAWTILPGCILNCFVNNMNFVLLFSCLILICRKKLINCFNKLKNKAQEYFKKKIIENEGKNHESLYNFISKEYPDVLKEYTEKEIIKHDSILDFLKDKHNDLVKNYKNHIKSKTFEYSRNRYFISPYKLYYENFSIVYIILYCNCTEICDFYSRDLYCFEQIANEMLEVTKEHTSYYKEYVYRFDDSAFFKDHILYFDTYKLKMAWIKLRNIYLLQYANLKQYENFYEKYGTYVKNIKEIFNNAKHEMKNPVKMTNLEYDIKEYLDSIKNIYKKIKDIEIPNEYKSKCDEFIEKVKKNLEKLEKFEMKYNYQEEIKDIDEIINKKIEDEISTECKQYIDQIKVYYNYIKFTFEELNEYSVEFNKDNYIKAHKAFCNNIIEVIEDKEFHKFITSKKECYVSYYSYDADVFLYDINIDNINKNDVQKVFTLYQELCTEVLKIYLSGKSNEDKRLEKYIDKNGNGSIDTLLHFIKKNSNELQIKRATDIKSFLNEVKYEFDHNKLLSEAS